MDSAEHGRERDARALIAHSLQGGEGFAIEESGFTKGADGTDQVMQGAGSNYQLFEARVAAEDVEREAAGCGDDASAWNCGVNGGDKRRCVNRGAECEGILQEKKIADFGELWPLRSYLAFQCCKGVETGGLDLSGDKSCADGESFDAAWGVIAN